MFHTFMACKSAAAASGENDMDTDTRDAAIMRVRGGEVQVHWLSRFRRDIYEGEWVTGDEAVWENRAVEESNVTHLLSGVWVVGHTRASSCMSLHAHELLLMNVKCCEYRGRTKDWDAIG